MPRWSIIESKSNWHELTHVNTPCHFSFVQVIARWKLHVPFFGICRKHAHNYATLLVLSLACKEAMTWVHQHVVEWEPAKGRMHPEHHAQNQMYMRRPKHWVRLPDTLPGPLPWCG